MDADIPRAQAKPVTAKITRRWRPSVARFAFSWRSARTLRGARGLTAQHHQAILAIKGHPGGGPISVGDLADICWSAINGGRACRPAGPGGSRRAVRAHPKIGGAVLSLTAQGRNDPGRSYRPRISTNCRPQPRLAGLNVLDRIDAT